MRSTSRMCLAGCAALVLTLWTAAAAEAQKVTVTAANPASGEQGTVSLKVHISGRNFEPGAKAQFFKSGTQDPSGITVVDTSYVSGTEVDATVNIDATAALTFWDIQVTNTSSRTGKGGDLFQTIQKASACDLPPLPTGFTQVSVLNPGVSGTVFSTDLGLGLKAARVTIGSATAIMVVAARVGGAEVFFLDPSVLPATAGALPGPGFVDAINPHASLTLPNSQWVRPLAIGDVDHDGTPDILAADFTTAALFRGTRDGAGHVVFLPTQVYVIAVPPTVGASLNFGKAVAMADLDGVPGDEMVVAQSPFKSGNKSSAGMLHLFRWTGTGVAFVKSVVPLVSPALSTSDGFGNTVDAGAVAGGSAIDLVGGSSGRGVAWILPDPWTAPATGGVSQIVPVTLAPSGGGLPIGFSVAVADVDGDGSADVVATSGWGSSSEDGTAVRGVVFRASVAPEDPTFTMQPTPGLHKGWSTMGVAVGDILGGGEPDVIVGAPNAATSSACDNVGALYVFPGRATPAAPWVPYLLRPPTLNNGFGAYGWSAAVVDGVHLLFVGEQGRNVNGVTSAGQVYVYRVDVP